MRLLFNITSLSQKKKLFISDYLFINQANINKIKNKVLAEYLPLTLQMQDKKGYINTQ